MLYKVVKLVSTNWVSSVKTILCNNGFGDVWENPLNENVNAFCNILKTRLRDIFIQTWYTDIDENNKLLLYKQYKPIFEYESYLDNIQYKKYRTADNKTEGISTPAPY